jgi:Outer membrane protein beta-barrel domain
MIGIGVLIVSASASAQPATANSVRLGLGFRYGFELEEGDFNPWGVGLGVEAGYTLPNAVYLGANFDYFFGDKQQTALSEVSGNIWQVMGEGGYDLGLGSNFVIRPKTGIGVAGVKSEVCLTGAGCTSDSGTHFAIAPGATFMLLTPAFFLSLDFRYDMIFADEQTLNALIFSAGIGR